MTSERDTDESIKDGRPVERAAERMAHDANDMQERSEKLGEGIEQTRQDWERKRSDQKVPGANPPDGEGDQDEE